MLQQKLSGELFLLIEPSGKNLRLIIANSTGELACRKETPAKLRRFLISAETNLFKGRVQLHKNEETISVILKGNVVGVIGVNELHKML